MTEVIYIRPFLLIPPGSSKEFSEELLSKISVERVQELQVKFRKNSR